MYHIHMNKTHTLTHTHWNKFNMYLKNKQANKQLQDKPEEIKLKTPVKHK